MSETPKNTEFRTLRSVRIASLTGHVVNLEPGHPQALPPELHAEAYAAGCVPVDSPDHVTAPLVPQGEEREKAIVDAINVLIVKGDPDNFRKADGVPKVAAIEEIFGFAVSGSEIEDAFELVKLVAKALNDEPKKKEDKKENKD